MRHLLKSTRKGLTLKDECGRPMGFPTRQDYIDQVKTHRCD